MTYLVWYLITGGILAPLSYLVNRFASKSGDKTPDVILNEDYLMKRKNRYRWLNKIANFFLLMIIMTLLWPLVVYLHIRNPRKKKHFIENKVFSIAHKDLQYVICIEDIEKQETPVDPMNSVPNLPFGHLNATWTLFKADLAPEDVLWTFSTEWVGWFEFRSIRSGYVAVRDEQIGSHFLTVWKSLPSVKTAARRSYD